jgi:hypothetical protein
MSKGLYKKYTVIKEKDGEVVSDETFVLKPASDNHAIVALVVYSLSVRNENPELADDLIDWIEGLN